MGICVVIPAFNAALTIRPVVVESLQSGLPVLVVNDGSTDSTVEEIVGLPVTLLEHESNRGKGAALRSGFAWAQEHGFEGIVTLDSDGQHDPTAIPRLISEAIDGGFDIVLASRLGAHPGGAVRPAATPASKYRCRSLPGQGVKSRCPARARERHLIVSGGVAGVLAV